MGGIIPISPGHSPKEYKTCLVDGDQIHIGMSLNTLLVAFTLFHRNI